jgi:hypothetical protein
MAKVAKSSGGAKRGRGGAKPGERRGGRKKGTPNRRTVEVLQVLQANGYDPELPFLYSAQVLKEGMKSRNARAKQFLVLLDKDGNEVWSRPTAGMMESARNHLSQYVAPQLSRVAVSSPDGGPMQVEYDFTGLPNEKLVLLAEILRAAKPGTGRG